MMRVLVLYFLACFALVLAQKAPAAPASKDASKLAPGKSPSPPLNTNNKNGPLSTTVFDYIVIGSGPAGAAVAGRLSETNSRTVLLIEAGGDALDFNDPGNNMGAGVKTAAATVLTPINWNLTPLSPIDWNYINYGEIHPLPGVRVHQAAGKALGGTSTINTMMYVKGNRADYDHWVSEFGCTGWGWSDVLPFFKKAENSTRYATNPAFHGNSGPINIGPGAFQPQADYDVVIAGNMQAAQTLGYPLRFTNDWNDGNSTNVIGFHEHTINNQTGQRVTSMEYITPYNNPQGRGYRSNLFVASRAFVNKITFDTSRSTPRATGVIYVDNRNNIIVTATANREVIVSAGALRSPQLLMLSGVGASAELSKWKIPLVANVPGVGQNLHDHPIINMDWLTSKPTPPETSTPAYSQSLGARCNTFMKSTYRAANDGRNDMQIIWLPPTFGYMLGFAYNDQPLSRGNVSLATTNPADRPAAIFNYFTDANDQDMNVMIQIVQRIMAYAESDAVGLTMWLSRPTDANGETSTDPADIRRFLLANYGTGYHYAGTCKMGPLSDPMAVVDTQLRVRGVSGLRVCDTSIMPQVTSGNTQAPTYMIGERCAAFVKTANP